MCSNKVAVPAWEWYGDTLEDLEFPDGWTIHEQRMAGHYAKPLSLEEITEKLLHPTGSPTLSELSKGKKKCVIIFDDMTRPTKTWQMLPAVLEELKRGGLTEDRIRFVMATGAHGAKMLQDFKKKLGDDIPRKVPRLQS
jgi:nickel-dependent lactate racemase